MYEGMTFPGEQFIERVLHNDLHLLKVSVMHGGYHSCGQRIKRNMEFRVRRNDTDCLDPN